MQKQKHNLKIWYLIVSCVLLLLIGWIFLHGRIILVNGFDLERKSGTIDTSTIKKIPFNPINNDDTRFCYGAQSNRLCRCPNGYVKSFIYDRATLICLPKICSYVYGLTGDESLNPNYKFCESAVDRKRIESCDAINYQQGKDLCVFAYVEATNDISVCEKIQDKILNDECKK